MADAKQSMELARLAADPQQVLPSLAAMIRVHVDNGQIDEARAAAEEMVQLSRMTGPVRLVQLALVAEQLGIVDEVRALLATRPDQSLSRLAELILDGELERAADELEEATSLPYAADVRLEAARKLAAAGRRAEADEQLRRALAFYRSVGATAQIREAEALLTAIA